jgi:hypothetical protein
VQRSADIRLGAIHVDTAGALMDKGAGLRQFGWLVLFGGAIWLAFALLMDTTVGETYNMGLVANRQIHITLAGLTLVCGVVLVAIGAAVSALAAPKPSIPSQSIPTEPASGKETVVVVIAAFVIIGLVAVLGMLAQ